MLIYKNDGTLFCISKKALQLAGYQNIAEFQAEHRDFSDLFVKRPGFIYNFENFSWISFLRNNNLENKKVIIAAKGDATYTCDITLETVYPIKSDPSFPEFFFQIGFENIKLENGDAFSDISEYHDHDLSSYSSEPEEEIPFMPEAQEMSMPEKIELPEKEFTADSTFIEENKNIPTDDSALELFDFDMDAKKGTETAKSEENTHIFDTSFDETPEIELKQEISPEVKSLQIDETSVDEIPDIKKISDTLGLPEASIKEFIKEFIEKFIADRQEIDAAIMSGYIHVAQKEAFELKGIAANLQMDYLTGLLESILNTHDKNIIESKWHDICAYMENISQLYLQDTKLPVPEKEALKQEAEISSINESDTDVLDLEEKDDGVVLLFNPKEAADALGLPESLIIEFTKDFVDQAREEKANFKDAYALNDLQKINDIGHKLKGVAANLRIEEMREPMENVQHAKSREEIKTTLAVFYRKLAALDTLLTKEYK